jgi:hypothetical protein
MVRPVINGPSLLETMMPTVSSDVTDSLSQTRVTFSAKPAPLDTPHFSARCRKPGEHVSQILCVAILRHTLLRRTFETHRPGTSRRAGCWSETSHMWSLPPWTCALLPASGHMPMRGPQAAPRYGLSPPFGTTHRDAQRPFGLQACRHCQECAATGRWPNLPQRRHESSL